MKVTFKVTMGMLCSLLQANSTFDALARLKGLGEAWEQNEPEIWDFFQNGSQVNTVRVRWW